MKQLFVVFAHLLSAFAIVLKPGGAKGLVAENLLLRQQLLILRRSRRRAPNLRAKDRLLLGFWSCFAIKRGCIKGWLVSHPTKQPVSHRNRQRAYTIITGNRTAMDCSNFPSPPNLEFATYTPYKEANVAFTKGKDRTRFAICLPPENETQIPSLITLKHISIPPQSHITLLGSDTAFAFQKSGEECRVSIPPALASNPYCEYAWVLKIAAP